MSTILKYQSCSQIRCGKYNAKCLTKALCNGEIIQKTGNINLNFPNNGAECQMNDFKNKFFS